MVFFYAIELALLVFALVDVIVRDQSQVRHLPKIAWIVLIILLPLAGSIIWFVVGHDWQVGPRNHGRYVDPVGSEGRGTSATRPATDLGSRRVSATEQELADLEREIAYWDAQARLKRAKEAAGEGDPTPIG